MNQTKRSGTGTKMVPISIGEKTTSIPASDLDNDATIHHGTASCGTRVNSPRSSYIGDSVGISPMARGNVWITMPNADFELIALAHLKKRGFKVESPSINQQ